MASRPSSLEARRRANRKNNSIVAQYAQMMRQLFPEDYCSRRGQYHSHPDMTAEREARVTLYQIDALAYRPIRYIQRTVRLTAPTGHGR